MNAMDDDTYKDEEWYAPLSQYEVNVLETLRHAQKMQGNNEALNPNEVVKSCDTLIGKWRIGIANEFLMNYFYLRDLTYPNLNGMGWTGSHRRRGDGKEVVFCNTPQFDKIVVFS